MAAHPPAFQFYPGDWLSGTLTFTLAEEGAYLRCISHQWLTGGVPADDMTRLAGVIRVTPAQARKLWDVIGGKFDRGTDGLWRNAKLEAVRTAQQEFHNGAAERGRAGAKARWQKHGSGIAEPLAEPSDSHCSSTAQAMPKNGSSSSSSVLASKNEASNARAGVPLDGQPPAQRTSYRDPHGFRIDPNAAALIALGGERVVSVPAGWATKACREYGLTDADIQAFAKWCAGYVQRHGFEDGGKRLAWLDARLADFRQERAKPNDGLRPASEWLAERQKRDAEIPEISAERRRELLRPVRGGQA